jgi:acetyltransferase-like isoleucine patch superfamily enzyme
MSNPRYFDAGIRDVTFGERVTIVRPANLYECRIGDDCFIGPFVEVQRGVAVGKKTRIQSHAFVCELVTIGEECFIGHGVMFINDLMRSGRPTFDAKAGVWQETRIGNRVSIGSNATILPVSVCDGVLIGAGSVVTKDIREPGVYAGNPARFLRRASWT